MEVVNTLFTFKSNEKYKVELGVKAQVKEWVFFS